MSQALQDKKRRDAVLLCCADLGTIAKQRKEA
jgi:hypothetical protein